MEREVVTLEACDSLDHSQAKEDLAELPPVD
jgi:hypothetical protein